MAKGSISVQTENIFPIIKKFLYSDQEIFLRELVSNAVDATTKLILLSKRGEVQGEIGATNIEIKVDAEAKTLTISDKGIGLTAEEAQRYLSEVAFSSASEFLEKYKDGNIIGHFGLGFYSAFMVADRVEVFSKSYRPDAEAIVWRCDGSPNYEIDPSEKTTRGTDIVLHISADAMEYLDENKIEELLNKYCKFLPIEIQFGTRNETETTVDPNDPDIKVDHDITVPNIINDTHPLWKKSPKDLTDDDYKAFYNKLYPFSTPPLFWIHLNIDYPFNLTGILYFPKVANALEVQKNKVQLYSNQVFVTDDVKEILPEFLTLLHGVIDSPDIPLNVSRSYLQSDREVKKITQYITKKVAEKLADMFKDDRKNFEEKWNDTGVFIKYGMLSDEKFSERAVDYALFKTVDGDYLTLNELKEKTKPLQVDKHDKLIQIYTNNAAQTDAQIQAAKSRGYVVLDMDTVIDNHFMQHIEYKENVTFVRVDSDTLDNLVQKDEKRTSVLTESEEKSVKDTFEKLLGENRLHSVVLQALTSEETPVQITRNEFMRRMSEMRQFQQMNIGEMPDSFNVVVNTNNPIISQKLLAAKDDAHRTEVAQYLYDLARVSQNMLKGSELSAFIQRSLQNI